MTFVAEHRDRYAVALLLRVLDVKPTTYYGWLKQAAAPAERGEVDLGLVTAIAEIHEHSGGTYGSPRVHATLRRRGIHVSRKRVERLMREHGLQGAFLRRGWRGGSTKQNPRHTAAADLVNRDFTAPAPNRLWVADATRLVTGEGVLWLATVRDAFSRRIVGWKTSDRCDTDLITAALDYAAWSRDIRDGQLIHHSDKGSNYTSIKFAERLADNGSGPRPVRSATRSTTPWRRTSSPCSRSSCITGRRGEPAIRPRTRSSSTSTGGTTANASKPNSAGSAPTSTRPPGTATSPNPATQLPSNLPQPEPGNHRSEKSGEPQNRR